LIESGARFAKVPRVLYAWRQHPTSATHTDPRYAQTAFDALRLDALARGVLRGQREMALIGVGRSLERWDAILKHAGYHPHAHAHGRPAVERVASLAPPAVLVFGAAPARRRWRSMLRAQGWVEGDDFAFVA
jgi:hypothetical protein